MKHVNWWNKLTPDEQQTYAEKYFPENMFGCLAMDSDDILYVYENEGINDNQ
jgi:hypothetical protein